VKIDNGDVTMKMTAMDGSLAKKSMWRCGRGERYKVACHGAYIRIVGDGTWMMSDG